MKQIYTKTMQFQLMKLLPGLASLILAIVLFIPVKLWCNHGLEGIGQGVVLLIWAGISALGYYMAVHYYGYLFRTAFMAAAAEYAVNQALPTSYRDFVTEFVRSQFKKPGDFLYLYRLVGGAVKDVHQGSYWKDKLMLDYLTMNFLCINFYRKKAARYKTIADAVVLFANNQKKLLARSQKTSIAVVGTVVVVTLVFWLILSSVPVLNWFAALVLSLMIAASLKQAFLDSWFLTRELLVCGRLEPMSAQHSYEELSKDSASFRKLYHKVRREQSKLDIRPMEFDFHSMKFCGECGALVAPETEKEENNEVIEQETVQTVENGDEAVEEILQKTGEKDEEIQGMEQSEKGGESVHQKVVFCGECGSAIFSGEAFCGECGAPAERKEEKQKFCGECGAPLEVGEKFCGECGTKAE